MTKMRKVEETDEGNVDGVEKKVGRIYSEQRTFLEGAWPSYRTRTPSVRLRRTFTKLVSLGHWDDLKKMFKGNLFSNNIQ